MTRFAFAFAAVFWSFATFAGAEAENRAVLLVDRRANEISFYFSLPATDLEGVFGQGAEDMLGADGTVDIDALYDGTFDTADTILGGVGVRIGGETVAVESLSMMLHDPAYLPAFADPYDAQIAVAVCTSPETVRGMGLSELRAYLGYFAWQVDGEAALELLFPETGRGTIEVTLREFVDFRPLPVRVVPLRDGGTLSLASPPTGKAARFGVWALVALTGLVLAGAGYYVARHRFGRRRTRSV